MDSDTADLDAQIAALQAQKARKLELAERARHAREKEEAKVLIGSTPTKVIKHAPATDLPARPPPLRFNNAQASSSRPSLPEVSLKPSASKLSSSLAALRHKTGTHRKDALPAVRSSSFYAKKPSPTNQKSDGAHKTRPTSPLDKGKARSTTPEDVTIEGAQRDEDSLTIINRLELGPKEFGKDPEGENLWEHFEPNSRVRLSKRTLSHELVQDHLRGRYFLPPSLLYSVIRLSRDGATYDVPVEGDWVTIAVVAERSEVRISGSKETVGSDSDDGAGNTGNRKRKQGDKEETQDDRSKNRWHKRRGPRKYINLKLASLPPRASSLGGKGAMGDALLQLLLFESDAKIHEKEKDEDGNDKFRYQGGSGGAYEKWCNLTEGTVVAILNARVLRPLRSGSQAPHPLTLPLALNPTSADAIFVIGQARDLSRCTAEQKDGSRCRTWVDLRQSQVCEYHVHAAVSRGRAGRAEFTASTSGFDLSSRPFASNGGKGGRYNPQRKQGLLPNSGTQTGPGDAGATYIVGGNAVRMRSDGGLRNFGDEHLSEKLGRGRAEKKKRKLEEKEAEKALDKLMAQDGNNGSTGAKYLAKIGRSAPQDGRPANGRNQRASTQSAMEEPDRKRPFGVDAVRRIGFDPTARAGQRDDEDQVKRMESIATLKDPDRPIKLGRPTSTSRSNVRAPPLLPAKSLPPDGFQNRPTGVNDGNDEMIDLD